MSAKTRGGQPAKKSGPDFSVRPTHTLLNNLFSLAALASQPKLMFKSYPIYAAAIVPITGDMANFPSNTLNHPAKRRLREAPNNLRQLFTPGT